MRIRLYQPKDRDALRRICWEAAAEGRSFAQIPVDREIFADVWTSYYTDVDASATWVLEAEGPVVGYLTGCLDEKAFRRGLLSRVMPRVLMRIMGGRRSSLRPLFLYLWKQKHLLGELEHDSKLRRAYPAHFHINLLREFRGHGWGKALVDEFFKQARRRSIPGVRAATLEENRAACAFFERLGFERLQRQPTLSTDFASLAPSFKVVYGRQS